MQVSDEKAKIYGINLHYQVAGEGALVVLLHGFPETCYAWRHQIGELANHFKVVALDLPGFGESGKPQEIDYYDVDNIAGMVAELIRSFGVDKAHLVGHDWGGMISWRVAQLHPDVVDKLVVLNAPHHKIILKKLKTSFRQMMRSWYIFFFQLPYLPEFVLTTWTRPVLNKLLKKAAFRKDTFTDHDIDVYVEAFQKPGCARAVLNYYRAALRRRDRPGFKNKITSPTLLIWGENDFAFGIELTEEMQGLFANEFTLKRIPNCSHWVNEEQPEVVNRLLLDFLTK